MKRYQSKILRLITNAPRYVKNQTLHTDIQIPFVHTFFQDHILKYRNTLEKHPSPLWNHSEHNRRLKRRWTIYATGWGNVDGPSPKSLTQLPAHYSIGSHCIMLLIANKGGKSRITWCFQVTRTPNSFSREWKQAETWKLLEKTWLFSSLSEAKWQH